jgi:Dolichyl-phosphate-mannose-protein mannosyltransferase
MLSRYFGDQYTLGRRFSPPQRVRMKNRNTIWPMIDSAALYRIALAFSLLAGVLHLISLPIEITYDGLGYIDMADVLGSQRFPHDWQPNRTPLYPLALKLSFWLFGRQPLAAMCVGSAMATAGILVLGAAIRRVAGEIAAAFAIAFLSLYPTLIAYEHSVLTEAGSFFFLAVVTAVALWLPGTERDLNRKLFGLVLVVTTGFYWRQNVLVTTPVLAFVLWFDAMRLSPSRNARVFVLSALRVALILVLPYLASKPWDRYSDPMLVRDVALRQGIIRQALLPPDDPLAASCRSEYQQAIADSMTDGNFYSGVAWHRLNSVSPKLFSQYSLEQTPSLFLSLVRQYPGRYLAGLLRTVLFFAGLPGSESDNRIYRDQVFSTTLDGSKISDGPEPLHGRIATQFRQSTTPSFLLRSLRTLFAPYDVLLIVAALTTAAGFVCSLMFRDAALFALTALPLFYLLSYAVSLVSIDRFMVPIYPMLLANLIVLPVLVVRRFRDGTRVS